MNNTKTICNEFKEQVWLYLDPDTDIQILEFWKKHLTSCVECSNHLESTKKFLTGYSNLPSEELSEEKFIEIIQNVISKKKYSFIETFAGHLYFFLENTNHGLKLNKPRKLNQKSPHKILK
jgi:hypothetical protein